VSKPAEFKFLLYIAGDGPNSIQAVANLNALCRDHLADRHEIEIVDVFRDTQKALLDGVVLTPMLMKLSPAPVKRIVGNLSQVAHTLQVLGLPD
jgi:circadian clock protein KaiB